MQQPSAPAEYKMQPPNAPPSYHEAVGGGHGGPGNVGWNVPHTGGATQPILNMQPATLHAAPSHTVPSGPSVQMHVVNVVMVGPKSINTTCPNCGAEVKTTTVTTPKSLAHLGCLALCLTGFWFCCCLPYCFDACKKTEHTCPNCKAMIGCYNG